MAFSFGNTSSSVGLNPGQATVAPVSTVGGFSFGAPAKPSFSFGAATAAPATTVSFAAPAAGNFGSNFAASVQPGTGTLLPQQVQKDTKFSTLPESMQQQLIAIDTAIKEQGRILAEMKSTDLPEMIAKVAGQVSSLSTELLALEDAFQVDKSVVDDLKPAAFHDLGLAETLQRKLEELKSQQSSLQSNGTLESQTQQRQALPIVAVNRQVANSILQADNELVLKYYRSYYEQAVARMLEYQKALPELVQSVASLMFYFSPSQQRHLFQREPEQLIDTAKHQSMQLRQLWTRLNTMHDQVCDFITKLRQLREAITTRASSETSIPRAHSVIASRRMLKSAALHDGKVPKLDKENDATLLFRTGQLMPLKEVTSILSFPQEQASLQSLNRQGVQPSLSQTVSQPTTSGFSFNTAAQPSKFSFGPTPAQPATGGQGGGLNFGATNGSIGTAFGAQPANAGTTGFSFGTSGQSGSMAVPVTASTAFKPATGGLFGASTPATAAPPANSSLASNANATGSTGGFSFGGNQTSGFGFGAASKPTTAATGFGSFGQKPAIAINTNFSLAK